MTDQETAASQRHRGTQRGGPVNEVGRPVLELHGARRRLTTAETGGLSHGLELEELQTGAGAAGSASGFSLVI